MKSRLKTFIIFLIAVLVFPGCLSIRLRTANENYQQFAYAEAIKDFEWVLQKKKIPEAIPLLADCYRQTGNTVKAEYWYSKAIKLPDAPVVWKNYLAEALMQNEKYTEARVYFNEYLELNRNDLKAKRMLTSCDSLQKFYRDTSLYTLQMMRFNSVGENNFSPAYYRSGIVFLSDKSFKGLSRSRSEWTGKRYLDLFYAMKTEKGNWLDPEPLRGDVNGRFNEGPAVFTKDFNTMYFTRNNYFSNKVEKNKKNVNVLKICRADRIEGEWKMKGVLEFNSEDYTVCHPAINSAGNIIYFSSDIPWGYGGMDLYMVRAEGNDKWSKPVNLGPELNSAGNEVFPSMMNDSVLYFSSDGLDGLGGLDIYHSQLVDDVWQPGVNLNVPVNSSHDDFGCIIDSGGTSGFFSSNRYAGVDKIFSFRRNQPNLLAVLQLSSSDGKKSTVKSSVTVFKDGVKDTVVNITGFGSLTFKVGLNHSYDFKIDNRDFYSKKVSLTTQGKNISESIPVEAKLERISINKPMIWPNLNFNKKEWQLKLDAGDALEKLVELLQNNPLLQIEIGSYTDSRGTESENNLLTQKRADLVKQYLVTRGIKADLLTAKGYGEQKLLNKCINGMLCIEEDHQVNNRVEISIKNILPGVLQ